MSERGEEMVREIMTAITRHTGITKAAGGSAQLAMVEAAVTPLAETIVTYEEHVAETLKELKRQHKILRAIARQPEQVPRGFMPYQPDQWRLTPKLPPQQVNGHDYTPGSNDDRPVN